MTSSTCRFAIAAFVLAWGSLVRAQVPESLLGEPIAEVRVTGPSGPIAIADIDDGIVGEPLSRTVARTLTMRLIATGRFADVQIEVDPAVRPLVLEARVVPRLRVARVDVIGNERFTDSEVRDRLGVGAGSDIDRSSIPRLESALLEAYRDRGYESTTVDLRLLDVGDGESVVANVEIEEGLPTHIVDVRFEGAMPADRPSPLRSLTRLDGDRLDLQRVLRARTTALERLHAAGYLEATLGEPTITRDGARATIEVTIALGPHFEVVVDGAAPITRGDVVEALDLETASLDTAGLSVLAARAKDVMLRAGFLRATAEVRVLRDRALGEAMLLVAIDRGPPVRMREIHFEGAAHFTETYLRRQIESFLDDELRGGGLGEPIDPEVIDRLVAGIPRDAARTQPPTLYVPPEERYYAPVFERAIEHIRSIYGLAGFVDASIDAEVVTDLEEDEVAVTISIHEGPRALILDVVATGNVAIPDADVAEALDLARGSPYSETALSEAVERVLELYRSHGYLYATVTEAVRFSSARTHAVVELTVNERFPVRVSSVRIEGARNTRDGLIRRLVAFEPGDLFTPERTRETEERLLELGIFSSVVVSPADADIAAPSKEVVVVVAERLPQVLDFGAGVSTGQGVRGSFEYSYRNLFGRAMTFTMRAQISAQFFFLDPVLEERFSTLSLEDRLERRITVGLVIPVLGKNPDFRTSFNVLNLRDNARTFGIDKSAFDITVTYRPNRRFALSTAPSIERNDVALLDGDSTYEEILAMTPPGSSLRQLLRVPEGKSTLAAVNVLASYDVRDNPFSPTRGGFLSVAAEWARSLVTQEVTVAGDETHFFSHHLRLTANASTYIALRPGLTLALQGRYGRIIHLSSRSDTYPNRQFFLGGVDTMRSYRQDAMVPEDVVDQVAAGSSDIDPVALVQGGDTFLLLRSELRFPIVGDVSGAVFGEFGNLWADVKNFEPWDLRPTAGLGVRFDTPVGPVALDYGFNVLYRDPARRAVGERIGAFNFSIGVF